MDGIKMGMAFHMQKTWRSHFRKLDMENEKLKIYFNLFTDFWKLFKKYSDVKDTEEYWEEVKNECYEIRERYGETEFVNKVLVEIQLELERCGRGK